jgi:hypothetical protein
MAEGEGRAQDQEGRGEDQAGKHRVYSSVQLGVTFQPTLHWLGFDLAFLIGSAGHNHCEPHLRPLDSGISIWD